MLQVYAKHAPAGAFDDYDVRVLSDAFDEAWKAAQHSEPALSSGAHAEAVRELLALRIIEMAQLGERDPNRLRDDAVLYLTRTNLKSTGL